MMRRKPDPVDTELSRLLQERQDQQKAERLKIVRRESEDRQAQNIGHTFAVIYAGFYQTLISQGIDEHRAYELTVNYMFSQGHRA